jgi:hypothetical protein
VVEHLPSKFSSAMFPGLDLIQNQGWMCYVGAQIGEVRVFWKEGVLNTKHWWMVQ